MQAQEGRQLQKQADSRKFLSVSSRMCIPFMSMNFFDRVMFSFFVVIHILAFTFKYNRMVYPSYASITELLILSLMILCQMIKYEKARQGVNNRHPQSIMAYIIISVFILLNYLFFLVLQTYVTMIEVIMNGVGIGYTLLELGLAVWLFLIFYRKRKIV